MKLSTIRRRAEAALKARDWLLASIRLEQIADREPEDVRTLGFLAASYFALCDFEDAMNVAWEGIQRSTESGHQGYLYSLYADSLVMLSDFDAAAGAYAKEIALCSLDDSYSSLLGDFAEAERGWKEMKVRTLDPLLHPMPVPMIESILDSIKRGDTESARETVFAWRIRKMSDGLESYQKLPTRRVTLPLVVSESGHGRINQEDLKAPEVYLETAARFDPASHEGGPVFLSYRSTHSNLVRSIAEVLIATGVPVWLNEYDVAVGRYHLFDQEILRGIDSSSFAVLFTSNSYANSLHCEQEVLWIKQRFRDCPERVCEVELEAGNTARAGFDLEHNVSVVRLADTGVGGSACAEDLARDILRTLGAFPDCVDQLDGRQGPRGLDTRSTGDRFEDAWAPLHLEHRGFRRESGAGAKNRLQTELHFLPLFPEELPLRFGLRFDLDPVGSGRLVQLRATDDVKKLFRRQRLISIEWERKQEAFGTKTVHHGTHLFWTGERAHYAVTYSLGNDVSRQYTLVLEHPRSGRSMAIQLAFRSKVSLEKFLGFTPVMDAIAGSIVPNASWRMTMRQKLGRIKVPRSWALVVGILAQLLVLGVGVGVGVFIFRSCGG